MSLEYDYAKVAKNILARRTKAYDKFGLWTACCEVKDCPETTQSSKLHGWSTERWVTCPKHTV